MRRREFIGLAGGAVAWPVVTRAQRSELPLVAVFQGGANGSNAAYMSAFRKGLNEAGYIEGKNVTLEYHFLEGNYASLPELLRDLIRRNVKVIATPGATPAALAAKAATSTIPIIFGVGQDPVQLGLVANLARPGGNATGVSLFSTELVGKQLQLLHDMLPKAVNIAAIVNPANAMNAASTLRGLREAAPTFQMQLRVLNATTSKELEDALAILARDRPDALHIASESFLFSRIPQIAAWTTSNNIPSIYHVRDMVIAGGLMSYGIHLGDMFHQVGVYTGRVLKGDNPAELPVFQPTKFEFIINLKTARTLGIEVPSGVLSIADEVIE